MATINYTLTVETSENTGHEHASLEATEVKARFEEIVEDLKISSGMAQIETTSLTEV